MRTSTGRSAVNVLGTLTSGLLLGLGVVACGTDRAATEAVSDTGPTATNRSAGAPSPDAGDPGRYCALTRQLEASGRTVFADLGHDATPAEYADAERTFVRANEDRLTALVGTLPAGLRDEMEVFVTGMRQRGGLVAPGTVTPREASAAERAVLGYEREHC